MWLEGFIYDTFKSMFALKLVKSSVKCIFITLKLVPVIA